MPFAPYWNRTSDLIMSCLLLVIRFTTEPTGLEGIDTLGTTT